MPSWPTMVTTHILLSLPLLSLAAPTTSSKISAGWYAGWNSAVLPISSISWNMYTQLSYSFAETTPDVRVLSMKNSQEHNLPSFVSAARRNGVKAKVAIGGLSGSRYFATNVGNMANRTLFVKTVVDFTNKYKLDGLDFDWEYPGQPGAPGNIYRPKDTANFLSFLQELRKTAKGAQLILSVSAGARPFLGSDGLPLTDVSGFANVLDYVSIMNYDVWTPWSGTGMAGPNTPLNDACALPERRLGSASSAVTAWNVAGMPSNKIILGVAAFSHAYRVPPANAFVEGSQTKLAPYPKFDRSNPPSDEPTFADMIKAGFLTPSGYTNSGKGILSRYDACSETPWVYNPKTKVLLSFDNAKSFMAKGKFIKDRGLKGFSIWEASASNILLDAIRGVML